MGEISKRKSTIHSRISSSRNGTTQAKLHPKKSNFAKLKRSCAKQDSLENRKNATTDLTTKVAFALFVTITAVAVYLNASGLAFQASLNNTENRSPKQTQASKVQAAKNVLNNKASAATANKQNKDDSSKTNHVNLKPDSDETLGQFRLHVQDTLAMSPVTSENGQVLRKWKELKPKKQVNSSAVRVYIIDDFISSRECDGLIKAHENHVKQHSKHKPIVCFSDEATMTLYLRHADVSWAKQATSLDFLQGTRCLNESLSAGLDGKLAWSHSTSFYPGESTYSTHYEDKVERYTGLYPKNGGKFQVTSYKEGVGYKLHTDCTEGNEDLRDRFATILVYLHDVEDGGETEFTELGISVAPKKGRALVWNNMDSNGNCDLSSYHKARPVRKGKKYILQRWYYYHNFPMLGKRSVPPSVPTRSNELTPRVSCDRYDSGSCRWYDEWNRDHLTGP